MKTSKIIFIAALLGLTSITGVVAQSKKTKGKKMEAEKTFTSTLDSVSYALGVNIGQNLKAQGLDSINVELISNAFKDVFEGKSTKLTAQQSEAVLQEYFTKMQAEKSNKSKAVGEKFLEENKKKAGVVTLPSGLQYQVIKEGTGAIPKETDKVTTHYHGTLIDGTVFDSSVERGQPATFPVNGVIKGWVEALQLMKVGSKWKLFVPSDLAYGERGAGGKIGPGTALIFEVELISIEQ